MSKPKQAVRTVRATALVEGDDPKRPRAIRLDDYWEPLADVRYRPVNNVLIPAPPQERKDDGMKTLRISKEAYARLRKRRRPNESVSQAVERMAFEL